MYFASSCVLLTKTDQNGVTETAGLDIVGPVWQGWTMSDDLRTGVIWLVIDVVDQ